MRRFAPLLITLTSAAVLIALNAYLFMNPPENAPILPADASLEMPASDNKNLEADAPKELLLIHAQTRPLFSPTRRPWAAPPIEPVVQPTPIEPLVVEPVVAVEAQPPQVTLIGIEKTPSGAKALLLKANSADAVWLKSGALIDEWTIEDIQSASVQLVNGKRTIKLELYPAIAPSAPAQEDPKQ